MDTRKTIEESLDLLRQVAKERDEREQRMGQLHLAIRGFCNLIPDKVEREAYKAVLDRYRVRTGLTDLVHLCLRTFDKAMTPKEIRGFIQNYGSEASEQQNLLQSVHTILRRMEENGEAVPEENEDGDKAYRLPSVSEDVMGVLGALGNEATDAVHRVGERVENRFLKETRRSLAMPPRTRNLK